MKGNNLTIAIGNQKGGVGKTTSTACIGAALALQGRRVLLIDLDAQQNLTFTLTQNEDPETSIYDTLVKDQPLPIILPSVKTWTSFRHRWTWLEPK